MLRFLNSASTIFILFSEVICASGVGGIRTLDRAINPILPSQGSAFSHPATTPEAFSQHPIVRFSFQRTWVLCCVLKRGSRVEEEGFEPPVLSYNGFQDRRLRPLGHSSRMGSAYLP